MADVQLQDGSIERTDPITGKKRIISAADYQRTRLTRERDAELAMQAGAPPIAKGPTASAQPSAPAGQSSDRYQTDNRELNVARAKADGQFDSKRNAYNAANTATQMDTAGTITPRLPAQAATPEQAPAAPKVGDPLPTATQAQAMQPRLPAPDSLQNMQMAAGPNISTDPDGLPSGSVGYQRADGTYVVETRDGQKRTFANETDARTNFKQIAARPQAAQSAEAFLAKNAAAQAAQPPAAAAPTLPSPAAALAAAPAPGTAGPTGTVRTANQGLPAAAPAPTPVSFVGPAPTAPATLPAPTFQQMQAEAVPVAPVLAAVMQAATAAPVPAPTPVNAPRLNTESSQAASYAMTSPVESIKGVAGDILSIPGRYLKREGQKQRAKEDRARMDKEMKSPGFQRELKSGIDERPVTPRLPERAFGDEDPAAFPTLPGSAGASRPRAILA